MMNKKRRLILNLSLLVSVIVIVYALVMMVINNGEAKKLTLTSAQVGREIIQLDKGDCFNVDNWNEKVIQCNEREYKGHVRVYGNITIGTSLKKLKNVYNISNSTAKIKAEVPSKEKDGTTDMINVKYSDNFFKKYKNRYLDAVISIGFEKVKGSTKDITDSKLIDGKWRQVSVDKIKDADLIYRFDLNGMSGENVDKGEIIGITIKYQ